jgi:hypothetical protein
MPIKKMMKKNNNKKNKLNNKSNNLRAITLLILISLLIALLLPKLKDKQQFIDTNIPLNQLEENFLNNKYSEILIDTNKAIATVK